MGKFCDLKGDVFGRLRVVQRVDNRGGKPAWQCQCLCGATIITTSYLLKSGQSKSCGCLVASSVSDANTKHGDSLTKEYKRWVNMISRCENRSTKDFKHYGGRGISICYRWRRGDGKLTGYECFKLDMGAQPTSKHSIDRIDVNGNYEPSNCRWATQFMQVHNRRGSKNGKTL